MKWNKIKFGNAVTFVTFLAGSLTSGVKITLTFVDTGNGKGLKILMKSLCSESRYKKKNIHYIQYHSFTFICLCIRARDCRYLQNNFLRIKKFINIF